MLFQLVVPEWQCITGKVCKEDLCEMPRENWDWVHKDRTMISYFELQCESNFAILASSLFFVPGTVVGLAASGWVQVIKEQLFKERVIVFLSAFIDPQLLD